MKKIKDSSSHKLDFFGGCSLVTGSILGTGIFIAPVAVTQFSTHHRLIALIWILGALSCMAGAYVYGKLATLFPEGGGPYHFLRQTLSPRLAEVYGWSSVFVICPLMLAASALFFTTQVNELNSPIAGRAAAVGLILAFTLLNIRGVRVAGRVQKALLVLQLSLFICLPALAIWKLNPISEVSQFQSTPIVFENFTLTGAVAAIAMVLWSFEGFNSATFVTSELKDGAKQVLKISLIGSALVVCLYMIFNWCVYSYLPSEDILSSTNIGATLAQSVAGEWGGLFVTALVIVGILTTVHTSIIIGPRISQAVAYQNNSRSWLAQRDPVTEAPKNALWLQAGIVIGLILVGSFQSLITLFVVMNWVFYGLTCLGFLKHEISRAQSHAKGVVALSLELSAGILFLFTTLVLLVSLFYENKIQFFVGLALLLVLYGVMGRRMHRV